MKVQLVVILLVATLVSAKFNGENAGGKDKINHLRSQKEKYADTFYQADEKTQYRILDKYRRDELYFTQGLTFLDNDTLVESSGLYGQSVLQTIQLEDAIITNQHQLDKTYFGEGSDIIRSESGDKIYMLTWKERKVFIHDSDLKLKETLDLPKEIKEGWGLTHYQDDSGKEIILVSDGTHRIFHVNPDNFKVIKTVQIFNENGSKLNRINELEWYKGSLLANIWMENIIVKIDPFQGKILNTYDFSNITNDMHQTDGFKNYSVIMRDYCLNGIAYNENTDTLIITGKKWPWFYKIELLEN